MARFDYLLCLAVVLVTMHQATPAEALPTRRFSRSLSRRMKNPSRNAPVPAPNKKTSAGTEKEEGDQLDKRYRAPVYLAHAPESKVQTKKSVKDGKQGKYRAPVYLAEKNKRQMDQMQDAPAIYADNIPPAPSLSLIHI